MAHKLVSYFCNWAQYYQARWKFLPGKINPSLFTYFNFAFGQKNLNLKRFLSTGGWSFNSCDDMPKSVRTNHPYSLFTYKLLSEMVAEPNHRTQFIKSTIEYAKKYGFDGIDIEWEYPDDFKRGGQNADYENCLKLLKEFRQTAGKDFIITIASAAIPKDSKIRDKFIQWLREGCIPILQKYQEAIANPGRLQE